MSANGNAVTPRQALAGWRLHAVADWLPLHLVLGLAGMAWLPEDWKFERSVLLLFGCWCGGMFLAGRAAIWQRLGGRQHEGAPLDQAEANQRRPLTGWRCHPNVAMVLFTLALAGLGGAAFVPGGWSLLRGVMPAIGMFAVGLLTAGKAAIWQPIRNSREG